MNSLMVTATTLSMLLVIAISLPVLLITLVLFALSKWPRKGPSQITIGHETYCRLEDGSWIGPSLFPPSFGVRIQLMKLSSEPIA